MHQFLLLSVFWVIPVLSETWRVATKAENWNYQIYEVQWFSDAACSARIANSDATFGGTRQTDQSPFGRDIASQAFDGDIKTAYKATWEAKCGSDKCYWVAMRRLRNVRCVKVHQPQTDWVMTVERLDGQKNIWEKFGSQKVQPGWNKIVLGAYTTPQITTCSINQNVVNGKCKACPAGGTNPAGDDSLDYNTVCKFDALQICKQNFHVKDGYCQPCPAGLANNAGDKNDKGDTQCDDNKLDSVFSFDVGAKLAVEGNFHQSTKGTVRDPLYPRKIASAVCGNSYFVAFTSQSKIPITNGEFLNYGAEGDTQGHVIEYSVTKGSFTYRKGFKFPQCREMVDVEVSDSAKGKCSVITALCIGKYDTHRFKNFKRDMLAATFGTGTRGMGWTTHHLKTPESCNVAKNPNILGMYLLEWNSADGGLKQEPAAAHLINTAIGNWRMGDWVISVNKDSTLLSVDLEVTVFGGDCQYHEGSLNTAWDRSSDGTLAYNREWSRGWAIGGGHTNANRLAYNSVLDNFGQFGLTDDKGFSRRFSAISADSAKQTPKGTVLYRSDHPGSFFDNMQSGGTSEVISFGRNGFIGSTTGAMPSNPNKERSMLAIARLPGTRAQWDAVAADSTSFKDTVLVWMKDLITPGYSAGWSSISHVGLGDENTNRFLLGWGEYEGESNVNNPLPSGGFYVVEVDKDGNLLSTKKRIDNSGWRDKQDWLYIPATGCVVWPGAWNEVNGPKGHYGGWTANTDASLFSTKLRISEYCPGASAGTNPQSTPTAVPTAVPAAVPTAVPAAAPGSCTGKDTDTRCAKWFRKGKCGASSVKFRCPQSCCGYFKKKIDEKEGACSGPDTHSKCAKWNNKGKCSFASVKESCPQSCCSTVSAKFEGFPPEDQEDIDKGIGWLDTDIDDEEISGATTGAEPALRMALFTAAVVVALLF
jgi:hypothetical protein